jgi:2-methylisocitrate lyase-like PEP mutase family enzyme
LQGLKQTMTDQKTKAAIFKALHVSGAPLVLFNVWDAGSAKAVASANAKALATGSWSVAAAHGLQDGENLSLDLAIANLKRIVTSTNLPISIDIESGYDDPARTIERTIEAGAIGCNLEDSFPQDGSLRDVSDQATRIRAARAKAAALGIDYFINARTDVFFQKGAMDDAAASLSAVLERASAYVEAGASGLFVPGLANLDLIKTLTQSSPLPVNIMLQPDSPALSVFAQAGVARLSYGPLPYINAMKALEVAAKSVLQA